MTQAWLTRQRCKVGSGSDPGRLSLRSESTLRKACLEGWVREATHRLACIPPTLYHERLQHSAAAHSAQRLCFIVCTGTA